jgi:hypothetical protein
MDGRLEIIHWAPNAFGVPVEQSPEPVVQAAVT